MCGSVGSRETSLSLTDWREFSSFLELPSHLLERNSMVVDYEEEEGGKREEEKVEMEG